MKNTVPNGTNPGTQEDTHYYDPEARKCSIMSFSPIDNNAVSSMRRKLANAVDDKTLMQEYRQIQQNS